MHASGPPPLNNGRAQAQLEGNMQWTLPNLTLFNKNSISTLIQLSLFSSIHVLELAHI